MKHIKLFETYCDSCEEDESPKSRPMGRMNRGQEESQSGLSRGRMSKSSQEDSDYDDEEMHHEFQPRDRYSQHEPDEHDVDDFSFRQNQFTRDYYENPDEDFEMGDEDDDESYSDYQPTLNRGGYDEEESEFHSQYDDEVNYGRSSQRYPQSQMEDEDSVYDRYSWRNRINERRSAKGRKPDFLDFDKDGNKKETMKKALKDKEKAQGRFGKKSPKEAQKTTTTRRKR